MNTRGTRWAGPEHGFVSPPTKKEIYPKLKARIKELEATVERANQSRDGWVEENRRLREEIWHSTQVYQVLAEHDGFLEALTILRIERGDGVRVIVGLGK